MDKRGVILKVLLGIQSCYAFFWALAIPQAILGYDLFPRPSYIDPAILVAPAIMLVNVYVYGALYVASFILSLRRMDVFAPLFLAGFLLNAANWVNAIGVASYNGQIGAVFTANGVIILMLSGRAFTRWVLSLKLS